MLSRRQPPRRALGRSAARAAACFAAAIALLLLAGGPARAAEPAPSHSFLFAIAAGKSESAHHPPEGFEDPCGTAVDSAGDIYVSDYHHHAIDIFNSSHQYLTQIADEDPSNGPCGLAVDAAGDLYVNNWHQNVVELVPSSYPPTEATSFGPPTTIDSARPTGVVVDPVGGDVYVDDKTYVAEYEPSGAPVEVGGLPLRIGVDPLASYYGLAVSDFAATAGDVYVADAAGDTVKAFDPAAGPAGPAIVIDGTGTPQSGFADLTDSALALDQSDGHLYVLDDTQPDAEHPAAIVDEFGPAGAYRGQLPHALVGGEPSGIAVDNSTGANRGDVYVTAGNDEGATLDGFGPTVAATGLAVAKTGSGSGTVISEPAGIDCGSACAAEYNSGEIVVLIAIPGARSSFGGWRVDGSPACPAAARCRVTLTASTEVSVEFVAVPQQTLSLEKAGSGAGTVTSRPAGIACATACSSESAEFEAGSRLTLTASPATHSHFLGWSGCDTEPSPTECTLTLGADRTVRAEFAGVPQQPLELAVSGAGEVSSSPAGIRCSQSCAAGFDEGAAVTLTATPAPHGRLLAWSGCRAEPTPSECEVTMAGAESVSAGFAPITHSLAVSVAGGGSVSAAAGPISGCTATAGTCSGSYDEGSEVALSASPAPDQAFVGWSGGGCSGTETCEVSIGADTQVHAGFAVIHRTLAVSVVGAGFGTVTDQPAGIDCGLTCAAVYDQGTALTLTAAPEPGSSFAGWSGCAAAAGDRCTVELGADETVIATFDPATSLTLGKATVKGAGAELALSVPGAGALTATGKGLKEARAHAVGAGVVRLRLALDGVGRKALERSRRRRLGVKVTVTFRPSDGGAPVLATETVTFKAKGKRP